MTLQILSDKPITPELTDKIADIFKNSKCPNESLTNSFENFHSFDGRSVVVFGQGKPYSAILSF